MADKKTILHMTGMSPTKYGSMEAYLVEIVKQCSALGCSSVIQFESLPRSENYLSDLKRLGARIVVLPTAHRSIRSTINLIKLVRATKAGVIQTHFLERHALFFAALSARTVDTKVVAMVHNVHHLTPKSRARIAYNRCDFVLGVSNAVHDDLIEGAVRQEKLRTHYLGLLGQRERSETARAKFRAELGIPHDGIVVANISFDAPFKGVDVLVESFVGVTSSFDNVYLLQVGVDVEKSKLPVRAKELGIDHRIRWAGIRDSGAAFLNAADIYVQPSRYGEGLPLAIMEAMAASLPVVATRVAGNSEAVVDNITGMLVVPEDATALGDAIVRMLNAPSLWEEMGRLGRERYNELFDGHSSVKRLIENYYRLAD